MRAIFNKMHFLYRTNDMYKFVFTRLLCTVYIISVEVYKDVARFITRV